MSSLDRILPFLKPIEDLLVDPTVTEVMVNDGGRRVFIERDGAMEPIEGRTLDGHRGIDTAPGTTLTQAQVVTR